MQLRLGRYDNKNQQLQWINKHSAKVEEIKKKGKEKKGKEMGTYNNFRGNGKLFFLYTVTVCYVLLTKNAWSDSIDGSDAF